MSFNISLTQAGEGDCIWLRLGKNSKKLNMVIDSGIRGLDYCHTVTRIREKNECVNVIVLTHDDDDHIKGLYDILNALSKNPANEEMVDTIYGDINEQFILYNYVGRSKYEELSVPKVVEISELSQADFNKLKFIYSDDESYVKDENHPFPNMIQIRWRLVDGNLEVERINNPNVDELASDNWEHAELLILSPNKRALKCYMEKAIKKLNEKTGLAKGISQKESEWDYSIQHWCENDGCTEVDKSLANNASISFLFFYEGKCILFGGDASPEYMAESGKVAWDMVKKYYPGLCYKDENNNGECYYKIDCMKVPHHGSSRNISRPFLGLFRTNNYLISTKGVNKNRHPGKIALAEIVKAASNEKVNVYANYDWWRGCPSFIREESEWNEDSIALCIENKTKTLSCHLLEEDSAFNINGILVNS